LLLSGDREERGVDDLVRSGEDLRADVLLLPHHGRLGPGRERLMRASGASLWLASCDRETLLVLPLGTVATAAHGALVLDLLPGGPRVRTPWAERAAGYDPRPPMLAATPALDAPLTWVVFAALLAFAVLATRVLRMLSAGGSAAAFALGVLAFLAFGDTGLATLFAPFLVANALGRLPGAKRHGVRRLRQVAANGLPAATGCVLALWGQEPLGGALFVGGLATLGADTCATEIGIRYGGTPRSILDGRPMRRGESGGVTLWGLVASLLGAFLAPVAWGLVDGFDATVVGLAAAAGLAAAVLDSVLGATLQYRGRDPTTGEVTESTTVDGAPTAHVAGVRWLDNDGVNLVSGLAGALVAAGLLGWLG
ncbi:MAG: DUF92 domain-containing protein, partial [Planctomycetota bacterium]